MNNPSSQNAFQSAVIEAAALFERMPEIEKSLRTIAEVCATALRHGNKILFCGNGGSAAECQHLATEFVVRLSAMRERRALPSIALTTDTSLLTACANDYGFDRIFARQVEALAEPGDVLILLSTSGKSPNLVEAAKMAHTRKAINISFVGETPTPLDPLSDFVLHIPSPASQRVQEGHLFCGHLLVELTEQYLFDADAKPAVS